MKIKIPIIVISLLFLATPVLARFYHSDADEVDSEHRVSSEYYNDVFSYEYPSRWYEIFDEAQMAYRASAGSYNVSRFYYVEDIKLSSSKTPSAVDLHFKQKRDETLLEQDFIQELRIQANSPWLLNASLLGNSGTFKKWGDLGAALGLFKSQNQNAEIYYWSVDHYYNTKEELDSDRYAKSTQSLGGRWLWQWDSLQVEAFFEHDNPLVWERKSREYTYGYQKKQERIKLSCQVSEGLSLFADAYQERKEESKEWLSLSLKKQLQRRVHHYQVGVLVQHDMDHSQLLLHRIDRNADYRYEGEENELKRGPERYEGSVQREEWAVSYTYDLYIDEHWRSLLGAFVNRVFVESADPYSVYETKVQTAFEYRFSERASSLWNVTWDTDMLKQGKPWGGGNIQFLIYL